LHACHKILYMYIVCTGTWTVLIWKTRPVVPTTNIEIKIHLSFHLNLRYMLRYLKYAKCRDFEPINNEKFSISLIFIFKWISDGYIVRNICYGLLLLINSYLNRKYTSLFQGSLLDLFVKHINIRCWNHRSCFSN
jgi:hypothetical protein